MAYVHGILGNFRLEDNGVIHAKQRARKNEHGTLNWPTVEENRVTRTNKYVGLSAAEKIQADCDMKPTNIILQGLPADIYSLVNHHIVAKDLWEKVQLLMQEVPNSETYLNDMENQSVHAMQDCKQTPVVDVTDNEITSDSNIILLSEDFGKHFTPQQELSAKQAFWLRVSNPTIESSNKPPVKVEVPTKLPKVSLVNASLKKLKFHLAQFVSVVKKRATPDARTEGEWWSEHTKDVFNNEIILFLKSLKDVFIVFDKDLLNEIMEVQTVFDQINVVVQQSLVDKQCLEIAKKELLLENDQLLQQIMYQDVLLTMMNSMSLFGESMNMERKINESCDKCFNLDAGLLKSQNAHNDLLKSNKKNDMISRTPSRNMKNKVEAQPRKVNKNNRVVEPIRDVDVKHSLLKANSELIYATCKKSMFDGVHDMCLLDFVKNVNSHAKSAKKH
nr:hypothetical protein [Tanacetum cinerariifolium]